MTAEEFAEAVDELIAAAREGGLSDVKLIVVLEDAVERLDEGLSAALDLGRSILARNAAACDTRWEVHSSP